MNIRDAVAEDAVAACRVMRRSIIELCIADHRNEQQVLASWLGNKTTQNFLSWIKPSNSLLVGIDGDCLLAVGCVTGSGEITLNYISPDARFRGHSRAMLAALEACAREKGNSHTHLESTVTAHRFYLRNGYVDTGLRTRKFGMDSGIRMSKTLQNT